MPDDRTRPICDWCRQMPDGKLCSYHQAMFGPQEAAPGAKEFIKAMQAALKGPTMDKTIRRAVYRLDKLVKELRNSSLSHAEARRLSIKTCEKLLAELRGTDAEAPKD